jgi:predicted esterase
LPQARALDHRAAGFTDRSPRVAYAAPMMRLCLPCLVVAFAACAPLRATQTLRLPSMACADNDTIFTDGYDVPGAVVADPSQGSGGVAPGDVFRHVQVPGLGDNADGQQTYYLHLPPQYTPQRAWPLLFALHGAAGSHTAAAVAARAARDHWADWADDYGFIVVAPVGNDAQGSWIVPPASPSDYDGFAAILADAEAAYNVERSRVYLWGFSAGGHVAWDLVLNAEAFAMPLNQSNLAGVAVSEGTMAFACQGSDALCDSLVAALPRTLPADIHIGLDDVPLLPQARGDEARLLDHGWVDGDTLHYREFAGGHTYTVAQLGEIWADLCPFARGP